MSYIEDYEFHSMKGLPVIFHYSLLKHGRAARPNWHENMEFLYFTEGAALVLCGDAELAVSAGDIVCIGAYRPHTVRAANDGIARYHCLIVDSTFSRENGIDTSRIDFSQTVQNGEARVCFEALAEAYRDKDAPYRETRVRGLVLSLLAILATHHSLPVAVHPHERSAHSIVRATVIYMRTHIIEPVSLTALAQNVGLSRFYFARLFRQTTGISPMQYLTLLRLDHACRLLAAQKHSIAEIAALTGFDSPSYFARAFRRHCGMLPREYARMHESKDKVQDK